MIPVLTKENVNIHTCLVSESVFKAVIENTELVHLLKQVVSK